MRAFGGLVWCVLWFLLLMVFPSRGRVRSAREWEELAEEWQFCCSCLLDRLDRAFPCLRRSALFVGFRRFVGW